MPPVLWQLQNSIFAEKARWALDFKGIEYRTHTLPPIVHRGVLIALRRGQTVPVLDLDDGRHVRDSTAIVAAVEERWPEPPLYPRDPELRREALALEEHFDEQVGHEARRVMLDVLLDHPDVVNRVFMRDFPRPRTRPRGARHDRGAHRRNRLPRRRHVHRRRPHRRLGPRPARDAARVPRRLVGRPPAPRPREGAGRRPREPPRRRVGP